MPIRLPEFQTLMPALEAGMSIYQFPRQDVDRVDVA